MFQIKSPKKKNRSRANTDLVYKNTKIQKSSADRSHPPCVPCRNRENRKIRRQFGDCLWPNNKYTAISMKSFMVEAYLTEVKIDKNPIKHHNVCPMSI